MGIDKIIPKGLSIDTDERLIKNGMMPDATNVTLSEGGGNSAGVLKNCKGTIPGVPFNQSDILTNYTQDYYVIGEVSDPQRGFIYFFVVDPRPITYIYQYNTSTDKYRLVLSDARFGLKSEYFVKADVVNRYLNQGSSIQTLLYFTDNVNAPRKINVDRALLGEYNDLSDNEWDYSVNSIKAASVMPPEAKFSTTFDLNFNNFQNSTFQFSTQLIYKDGEESALSPYSKLAFSERLSLYGIDESNSDESVYNQVSLTVDNTCSISLNLDQDLIQSNDLSSVRLLAREGNSGPFFVIDEFDPKEDLERSVYGGNITVYDSSSKKYKFFNDILGSIVPTATEDKLYDNVPFKARGQSIVGNRLMYSNYTEGRPNVKTNAEISVSYKDDTAVKSQLISQVGDYALSSFVSTQEGFTFKPQEYFSNEVTPDTIFDAGTEVLIEFGVLMTSVDIFNNTDDRPVWGVNVSVQLNSQYDGVDQGESFYYVLNEFTSTDEDPGGLGGTQAKQISMSFILSNDLTVDELISEISNQFSQLTFTQDYNADFLLTPSLLANNLFNDLSGQDAPNLSMQAVDDNTGNNLRVTYGMNTEVNDLGNIDVTMFVSDVSVFTWDDGSNNSVLRDADSDTSIYWTYNNGGALTSGIDVGLNSPDGNILTSQPLLILFNINYEYSILSTTPVFGFKSGSLHNLGIVYYDKHNRSGFVNDVGSPYVGWYNDHSRLKPGVIKTPGQEILRDEAYNGPASITLNFLHEPPVWAESFQIVYPGRSVSDSFVQYSVVGAFAARKGDFESTNGEYRGIDTQSKRIYVSLDSLDIYRDQKNTFRDYSFTKGDKLRVKSVSYQESTNQTPNEIQEAYYSATDGSIIEFDIVDVELLTNDITNPIAYNTQSPDSAHGPLNVMSDQFLGKFLVLESPQIVGGALGIDQNQIKYIGFDWYHVSYENTTLGTPLQTPYPDGSLVTSALNLWQRQCIVEIYSPKKSSVNEFYYEIGESIKINRGLPLDQLGWDSYHGPAFTIDSGDVHYRPVSCKTADYVDPEEDGTYEFRWYVKDDWAYKTKVLEDASPSDVISDAIWSKGRPHVKFENADTVRRFNGITYSDAYEEDVSNLSLSSFNATLANFGSLEAKYGAVNYIYNYGSTGELLALQENKMSLTSINTNILFDVSGNQNVALSTKVLNSTRYFVGDFGCGDHPEAVLVYDNDVFFVDVSRKKVLRFSNGQLVPISDKDVASRFNQIFNDWSTDTNAIIPLSPNKIRKIISGYDPDEDTYYVSFYANLNILKYFQNGSSGYNFSDVYSSSQFNGYTMSYNVGGGFWQSKHSFVPTIYSNQNNTMYSCKYVFDNSDAGLVDLVPLLFHKHDDLLDQSGSIINRTIFYNQNAAKSDFTVVSNAQPSNVKVYDALSYEGSKAPDSVSIVSSNGSENDRITGFQEREDSFYVMIPRDTSVNSTSQFRGIGFCTLAENDSITISGSLIGISIPIGAQLVNQSGSDISGIGGQETTVLGVEGNKILVSQTPFAAQGQSIILVSNPRFDGDAIRGHYATIKSEFTDSLIYEIYCVNAHVTNSDLHHGS